MLLSYKWILSCVMLCFVLNAQAQSDNTITLSLNYANYDCQSGTVSLSYHIVNSDENGYTHYKTQFNLSTGSDSYTGSTFAEQDIFFTGVYLPGDNISLHAYGISNNAAPETQFDYVAAGAVLPPAPTASASPGTFLCNGSSTTLSAMPSAGGTITWSNGMTGNSITVSASGSYYAYEVTACGTGPNSNTITVTTGNSPGAPSLTPAGLLNLCNGNSTTINIAGGGNTNWFRDGGLIAVNSGTLNVNVAGTYTASLNNACGSSIPGNAVVITTANTPAAPTVSSNNGTLLCDGASTVLSATPSAGGSVNWSTGSVGNSITVGNAGTYYAYEANSCGNSGNSNTITLTTNITPPAPVLNVTGSITLCDGAGQIFTTSLATPGGTIFWVGGSSGNSITVYNAGLYYAYETNGCGNGPRSANTSVSLLNKPVAPTVTPPGNQLLCNGQSATFNSTGSNVSWSNGVTGNSLTTSVGGTYYSYDNNYCGNSPNSNAVVISTATCPTPSAGSSFFICPGTFKTLDAGAGYDTYSWSSGQTTRSIVVGPGNYSVSVTKNGCAATSATVAVSYYTVTTPTISSSGPTTFCSGGSVTLTSSTGSVYAWSNGASTGSITVTTSGSYSVRVTDGNGCQSTSSPLSVTVNPLPNATIGGTATVCQNSAAPLITFTGSGGTAPYTFLYKINGGTTQTITTSGGNSISVGAPTGSAGTYIYSLVGVQESGGSFCSNSAGGSATITVNPLPFASISGSTSVCRNAPAPSIIFTGSNSTAPYTFTYTINGGTPQTISTSGGSTVSLSAPTSSTGTYTYTLVGVQGSGGSNCSNGASGSATITVNPLPSATISGTASVCQNAGAPLITFTGSNSTAPYTFTYTINGGAALTVSTSGGNSVSISVPTSSAGTYSYALTGVQGSGGTNCINSASGGATVTINPLPSAGISGSATVCQNSTPPLLTFTGNGVTAPYTFTYRINGGANQTITTTSGNSVTLSVPTSSVGTYTYSLIGVQESSGLSCNNSATGSATVIVRPLPSAGIAGGSTVCQNSGAPAITFTGNGASAPYTFTYTINNGANQTVTTTGGSSSVSINVATTSAGTYTYALTGVQESGGCANSATGSAVVVINPQPAAAVIISPQTHLCNSATTQITISNFQSGFTYSWYKDGVLLTTSATNSITVSQSGSYTAMVTSDKGCNAATVSNAVIITTGSISTPIITGYLKVCEGGKTRLVVLPANKGMDYELYRWTDTPIGDSLSNDKSFSAFAGQYRVLVMREGCFDSTVVAVTANDTEFPAGHLQITPNTIPYGGSATLVADVRGAARYEWDLGDSRKAVTFSGSIQQNFYRQSDSLSISVRAISERNCAADFTATLKVGAMERTVIPDRSLMGNLKDWNLFPLPFHQELKLSVILKRNETVRVDLFSFDGSWIMGWQLTGRKGENLFRLERIETLPSGITYLVTAVYNGEKHFEKIYKY